MKILRCIYPPSGRASIKEISFSRSGKDNSARKNQKTRIEIYNMNGEFVYIFKDRDKISNLRLPEGLYLMKEKDTLGKVVKSCKLIY
jgi:hypothetical protein